MTDHAEAKKLVAEIEAGLEGVTLGPWYKSETWRPPIGDSHNEPTNAYGDVFWGYSITGSSDDGAAILPTLAAVHNFPDSIHANAAHIERCNPKNMRTIFAYVRALEAERDRLTHAAKVLFEALDNIDSASDIAKGNNRAYRRLVEYEHLKRFQFCDVANDDSGEPWFAPNQGGGDD